MALYLHTTIHLLGVDFNYALGHYSSSGIFRLSKVDIIMIHIFWDVTPCRLVNSYRGILVPSSSRLSSPTSSGRLIAKSGKKCLFLVDMSLTHLSFGNTSEEVVIR